MGSSNPLGLVEAHKYYLLILSLIEEWKKFSCPTGIAIVQLKKSKSSQKHLLLSITLPNYVLSYLIFVTSTTSGARVNFFLPV